METTISHSTQMIVLFACVLSGVALVIWIVKQNKKLSYEK